MLNMPGLPGMYLLFYSGDHNKYCSIYMCLLSQLIDGLVYFHIDTLILCLSIEPLTDWLVY